jgi:hypothetical protein
MDRPTLLILIILIVIIIVIVLISTQEPKEIAVSYQPFTRQASVINSVAGRSSNWAGYIAATSVTRPAANSATFVQGSFKIPRLTAAGDTPNDNVSIWAGIDGGFESNPTVQQIGVNLEYVNGQSQAYAWFEMYPAPAYQIVGFPTNFGDEITTSVMYMGSGIYRLRMINVTRKVQVTVPYSYTKSLVAKRQCVEWVVEAPSLNGVTTALSSFTPAIQWTKCSATIVKKTGAINAFPNIRLTMASGTQIKTSPTALNTLGTAFSMSWTHI